MLDANYLLQQRVISGTLHTHCLQDHPEHEPPAPYQTTNFRTLLTIQLRRLARRGGVKRISGAIYEDMRRELKERLRVVGLVSPFL
jgi:hypothetical protein